MIQSFYTGNAGLNANKEWLSVISDNIANVNTVGYKAEVVNFNDLISRSFTAFSNNAPKNIEIGGGAFVASTVKDFSQGSLMNTNSPTDLALDGEGFFMVKDQLGTTYYTRAGQFRTDADGNLININGMYLLGWTLDEVGNIAGAVDKIQIPNDILPKVTTNLAIKAPANLDAGSPLIRSIFNTNDATTYSYVNAVRIYDSIGVSHEVKYYFVHEAPNVWKVFGTLDDENITFVDGNNNQYAFLRLEFNGIGQINKVSLQGKINNFTADNTTATNTETLTGTSPYELQFNQIQPGTLSVSDGTNTYTDDGNGNIIDNTGNIVGTIDYVEGVINTTITLTSASYNYYTNGAIVEKPGDLGTFYVNKSTIMPGSVVITSYERYNGTAVETFNVRWIDDGNGNIIDLDQNNLIIGSINYDTGEIVINQFIGDGKAESLTINFDSYAKEVLRDTTTPDTTDFVSILDNDTTQRVIPGTVYIRKYTEDQDNNQIKDSFEDTYIVDWIDDGNGNIVDRKTNTVIGTIDYNTGVIKIDNVNAPQGTNISSIDVVFEYEDITGANITQATNIDMAPISTKNSFSATLNTGGNDIQYNLDLRELKQLESEFIFYAEQDGYGKGDLLSVSVSEDGLVRGIYSNGQVRDWARIAVATFKDKEVLVRKGNNLYLPNSQTFTPIIVPGGVISKIRGGFLELSNVDISREFINLITAQRAYQANARTITTSDQVLQETMNLKR